MIRIAAWLATLLVLAAPVAAHTRSESHSAWTVARDGSVSVVYAVPRIELQKLRPDHLLPATAAQRRYVADHLWVTVGGARCAAARAPVSLAADTVFQRVQLNFHCPRGTPMVLHATAFFDIIPNHMHFAQVQTGDGDFIEQLFTDDATSLDLSKGPGGTLASAGLSTYVEMGIMHILTGVDHMAFLLGLVLIARRLKDLLFVVTGFTIGHSLTLALAVTGILRPHAEYIDALVAFTILLIGAENIALATRRPGIVGGGIAVLLGGIALAEQFGSGGLPLLILIGAALFSWCYLMFSVELGDAGRLRLLVTLVFGLIHGFGFAAGLLEMELPKDKLFQLLLGFNVGVELGQLTVVLLLIGAARLLVRVRLALPRALTVDLVSAMLAATGTYWMVGRSITL